MANNIIAGWGSVGSGTTLTCVKIAKNLAEKKEECDFSALQRYYPFSAAPSSLCCRNEITRQSSFAGSTEANQCITTLCGCRELS